MFPQVNQNLHAHLQKNMAESKIWLLYDEKRIEADFVKT